MINVTTWIGFPNGVFACFGQDNGGVAQESSTITRTAGHRPIVSGWLSPSLQLQLDIVLIIWQCSDYLTVCWLPDSVLIIWQCADYLTVCWISDSVLIIWHCADYLTVCLLSDSVLMIWQCADYLTVCWLSDIVLIIWQCAEYLTKSCLPANCAEQSIFLGRSDPNYLTFDTVW